MTRGFQVEETIDKPCADVWRALTDWERAPEWMGPVERIEPVGNAPVGVGTKLAFHARGAERHSEIVAFEPERTMALSSTQGGVTAVYTYTCEPQGQGCRVRLDASCEARGFGWKLMHPLITMMMKRVDGGQLSALKTLVEGSSRTPSS